jgi:hypothetical protein
MGVFAFSWRSLVAGVMLAGPCCFAQAPGASVAPNKVKETKVPVSLAKLPTPSDAARDAAAHGGDSVKAYQQAAAAEKEAFDRGQFDRLSPESLAAYRALAQAEEQRKAADTAGAKSSACLDQLVIGAPENVIYCALGNPDRTNSDSLGDTQLVFSLNADGSQRDTEYLVYVDPKTRLVTDVQTSK